MKFRMILLLGFCLSSGQSFAAETLKLAGTHWPPYEFEEQGHSTGIVFDIINEAAKQIELSVEMQSLPWKRTLKEAKEGRVDGISGVLYTEEREEFLHFTSVPLLKVNTTIFALKDGPLSPISNLEALKAYRLGIVGGYAYGAEFDTFGGLEKYECSSNEILVQNLAKGRIDAVVMYRRAFQFYSLKYELQDRAQEIYSLDDSPVYLAFSKNLGSHATRLALEFDRVFSQMNADGRIERIIQKHLSGERD